jgi:uncharacterized membrane protein
MLPMLGCFGMLLVLLFLCLMPLLLVDVMRAALARLHLDPATATLAVVGIFLGGLINLPVYRIERHEEQVLEMMGVFGVWGWTPRLQRVRRDTVIAVNVGGCLIPCGLAAWQILHLADTGGWPLTALVIAAGANILACYLVAQPVSGIGIMMPGFASPAVAVGMSWLLLMGEAYDPVRAPVAFVAGVLGPVVGADLLHLKDITKVSVGMLSIGGAGTFDGIVLSGILAALLA